MMLEVRSRIWTWLFVALATSLLAACGAKAPDTGGSAGGGGNGGSGGDAGPKLGAPIAIAGDPVGSAIPVTAPTPVARKYGNPIQLTPPDQREKAPASGLTQVGGWLNTTRAFTGDELTGRILLLDFWTAGCINCIHEAATLEAFSHEHENDPVLVIGVHAQKFSADASPDVVRAQMIEMGVTHPVTIDAQHKELHDWGAPGWPTLYVVDAHGRIITRLVGEASLKTLDDVVESALHEQAAEGGLATTPLGFLGREKDASTPLASPEKIISMPGGFAIADTGHNRVVLTDATGAVTDVIGDGTAGKADGPYASARFSGPKGLALDGNTLYVADTQNHLLRAVDLSNKSVSTVAGTGDRGGKLTGTGKAIDTALASPWDLLAIQGTLYIANAGTHQIATYDPSAGTISAFAGSAGEGLADGGPTDAQFAQPSGLATDGTSLYVADAESSSVREVDLASGNVTTLVGKGLFNWGDVDGPAAQAQLQHDQGLAIDGTTLYIADTYNSKIKALDLTTQVISTIAGDGTPPPLFYPGGLAVMPSSGATTKLLVADTDHDQIVIVDTSGTPAPQPWPITGLSAP